MKLELKLKLILLACCFSITSIASEPKLEIVTQEVPNIVNAIDGEIFLALIKIKIITSQDFIQ